MARRIVNTDGGGTTIPRNPVARSAMLRKGGVHEKGKTAKRQRDREALNNQLEDWREELAFERELKREL